MYKMNRFGHFWTSFDKFRQIWTRLDKSGQIMKSLNYLRCTVFPEIVTPALVLNLILCTVVQCSIKRRRESKVIVQDEQVLFVLSWMSDLGGLGRLGS